MSPNTNGVTQSALSTATQRKKQKSSTPHTGTQAPGEKQPTTQYNWLSAADVKLSTMTTVRPDTR